MRLVRSIESVFRRGAEIGVSDLDRFMEMMFSGAPSASGAVISEQTSLRLPAVWACVDLISKAGSILPGKVYRWAGGPEKGLRELARNHYLFPIIHDRANPTLPAAEWRRLALAHLLTWGNHYSWIEWTDANRPKNLWIIPPDKVKVRRESMIGEPKYSILDQSGIWKDVPSFNILHIRGLGYDGTVGYSPVTLHRNQFGLLAASEQSASNMHKNGITSRLALEPSGQMDPEQIDVLRKSIDAAYGGLGNQFRALLLPFGIKASPISINPHDAQFLEQWKYSDSKIYQIYGVPPHMVGDTEKATSWGTGIEQQTLGFVKFTLLPLMNIIETWLAMKLLPDGERTYFIEYDAMGLLRGDTQARAQWHRSMVELGVSSPNDVRRAENESPYEGGDVYRRPLNTAFVDKTGKVVSFTPPSTQEVTDEEEISV